jgi:hypothetical protein
VSAALAPLSKLSERLRVSRVPAQRSAPGDLEVLLALPAWSVMRSTDRDYVYGRFPQLNQHFKLRFTGNDGLRSLALSNLSNTLQRIAPNLRVPWLSPSTVPGIRVAPSTHVVFSYGPYPLGLSTVPILWEHTFAPKRGDDEALWHQQLRAAHLRAAGEATRIVTATEVSTAWFRRVFPEHAHKISTIPYYMPHLAPLGAAALQRKAADSGKLRVLFVGKQARRKGLDSLVAAWPLLTAETRAQLSVCVVSGMYDGPIALPPEWTHHSSVPDVMPLMHDAHVLAFPTKHEAYGLVLVEGLAAGCAVLTTSAEIQRSIVGPAAGSFVDPTSAAQIAEALTHMVKNRDAVRAQMYAGHARFAECYAPELVGTRYAELLWETAGRSTTRVARE